MTLIYVQMAMVYFLYILHIRVDNLEEDFDSLEVYEDVHDTDKE